jgi:hypothetical protein
VRTKILLSFIAIIFVVSLAHAENGQFYFKFQAESRKQLDNLTQVISIDNVAGTTVFAYANEREFAQFKKLGIPYEILPDPGSLIVPAMAPDLDHLIADWDVYPTYQQYLDMMNLFATTYPDLCTIVNIGTTVQGRQMLYAKISDNVNTEEDEPEVQYSSSMHGDETTGYVLMLRLIDYLLTNYGTDPQVTNMVNNMEIWINPLANPDGTYHGGNNSVNGAIRYNANSIDLNRNFIDPAAGQHPDGNAWQPETINYMNFFRAHTFVISANFHGGVEVVNYLWDTWVRRHPDDAWCISISRAYADSVHVYSNYNGYMTYLDNGITNGYDWYRVTGGRQDFMTYFTGGRESTIEISNVKLLPAGQLPSRWTYNKVSFLNYLENALYGVRGLVTNATNGAPLAAIVNVLNHDADSARVFTDPQVGDYHRMLAPGTYSLQFVSPGFVSQTITGVTVTSHNATILNVQLQPVSSDPDLAYLSNDAGFISIGDTALMHITLINNGGGSAVNPVGVLSTSDSYVGILQNSSNYPTILPFGNGVSQSQYRFTIAPDCPSYHTVNFRLGITANGGYIDSAFFSIVVGQMVEDFESGNFLSYPWQFAGNANWTVSTTTPYQGAYSARSGVITHNQSTQLSVQMNVASASEIRFHYKVSSEADYDFLTFYIDNTAQEAWSGEVAWSEAVYNVSSGLHTFKWIYSKDGSESNGSDCGFIDNVIFPRTVSTLEILTSSLPDWTINRPYSQQLHADGGIGGLTWDDRYGNLSGTGLTLSSSGLVSGTPVNASSITFTARVQDTNGGTAQRQFTFTINPHLDIVTEPLPDGTVGMPYSAQLNVTGGTGTKTWADWDNGLGGTGLTFSSTGLVSGTPVAADEVIFTAQVTDIAGDNDSNPFQISIFGRGTYLPGDVNNNGQTNGIDVGYLVNYFKGGDVPPLTMDCPPHGSLFVACDVNGNCAVNGIDVTYLVSFFKGGPGLMYCVDCPPASMILKANSQSGEEGNK